MRKLSLLALLLIAACGTPQERCINRETRELRSVQNLLAEVEGNLARGYAYEDYEVPMTRWEVCGATTITRPDGTVIEKPQMCLEDYTVTRTRKVAIDPAAETRKRDGLRKRVKELTPAANAAVAACREAYPET
ncbi:hypothetical protein SAMN05877809_103136 [Rhodobacter sp. JA431]|uniref:hypothetical protein n=1 Tax=Rhodobacter sp. JA431 TaxID=570013 RepID=UPI000BC92C53|nr:hypothetical protein [Rhodobacter sp. JA431]SOC04117.1 hypothetical protein SAMN05877809_103136 [Rhodobacter sp. JA431]